MLAFWKKLKATLFRRQAERELEEDVRCHLDMLIEENIQNGMDPEEARYAARRSFGGVEQVKETYRDKRGFRWLDSLLQDIRFGIRMLRRNPVFTVAAILTLGVGIGGNTTIFTVIRAVLLKQLVYSEPDRLVYLSTDNARRNRQDSPFTLTRLEEMRASSRSFTGIGAFLSSAEDVTLSGTGEPEALKGSRISANFLDILGVQPLFGRSFLPGEDTPGGAPVAMISTALWNRRFGADPLVIGKTVTLDSMPHTIIGVLPPDFQFPFAGVDIWVTRPSEWSRLPPRYWRTVTLLKGFARLKPDVSLEQAQAEMVVLNNRYLAAHPDFGAVPGVTMRVARLKDRLVQNVRPMLLTLFGAVGFVLLIACANVASLILARATSRSREFAVRAALGAGRGRLIRQSLAESLVLAAAGGALGVLLANWGLHVITGMNALDSPTRVGALSVPGAEQIKLDGLVFGFTVALSMATGILFGLFPSLRISRPDLVNVLRESGAAAGRGSSGRRGVLRVSGRSLLVIGQVALSIILLIGAMLLIESLTRLHSVNPGFQTANLLTAKLALPPNRYDTDQKRAAFFEEVVTRTKAVPGVGSATVAMSLPTTPWIRTDVKVKEQPPADPNEVPTVQLQSVTPRYFHTLGIPLRRGREFNEHDNTPTAPPVVIINERFARRFWPSYPRQGPIGQHISNGADKSAAWLEIVGVVSDVHEGGLAADAGPEFYVPIAKHTPQTAYLAAHRRRSARLGRRYSQPGASDRSRSTHL